MRTLTFTCKDLWGNDMRGTLQVPEDVGGSMQVYIHEKLPDGLRLVNRPDTIEVTEVIFSRPGVLHFAASG